MKCLYLAYVWPEPTSSAAGVRSLQVLQSLRQLGFEVHVASHSKFNEHSEALDFPKHRVEPNHPGFDDLLKALEPGLVVFDRFIMEEMFGWRVREVLPKTLRVIDTQDLHFLRRSRAKGEELLGGDACREVASIYRSDQTWVLSDYEYDLLLELGIPAELIRLNRFAYPKATRTRPHPGQHFATVGNFRHPPNADAVRQLYKDWPRVREQLPQAELHIYGAYPPKDLMGLRSPGFEVRGPCQDVGETLSQYRVLLAPLRFGAGNKGKILEAWRVGTPVVTTDVGAEGMGTPFGGLVTQDWVSGAVELYTNSGRWEQCQRQGWDLLDRLFEFEANTQILGKGLEELRGNLHGLRTRNFTGQMLWHHTLSSTKYFSKWIEAKHASGHSEG